MAKRTTDLLDVFRRERGPQSRGGGERRAKGSAGTSRRKASDFEGVFLTPRQLLLLSCVILLLLVLAFMVGLGVGRDGGEDASGNASSLQRTTGWYVRGFVPGRRVLGGSPVDIRAIEADLRRVVIRPPLGFRVLPTDRGTFEAIVGPFPSRKAAERFLNEAPLQVEVGGRFVTLGLRKILVQDGFPFFRSDERRDVYQR